MGGTIKRFQDIKAWQEAREVVKQIYTITKHGELGKDFILRDQIRRAALSITLNIAEGFGRGTDREFSSVSHAGAWISCRIAVCTYCGIGYTLHLSA